MILAGIEREDETAAAVLARSGEIMLQVSPQAPDPSDLIAAAKRVGEGTGLGVVQTYPIALERLRLWAASLGQGELVFVAASAFVLGGTTGEAADHRHNGSELAAALG